MRKILDKAIILTIIGISLILIVFAGSELYDYYTKKHEKVLMHKFYSQEPVQQNIQDYKFYHPLRANDTVLISKANYNIQGKIIAKQYPADKLATVSPVDISLAWGDVAEYPEYSQHTLTDRTLNSTYDFNFFKDDSYVRTHISNNHIIPADTNIANIIQNLQVDDLVLLEGYLVDIEYIEGRNTYTWNTSLVRTDSGKTSCEILFVTKVVKYTLE